MTTDEEKLFNQNEVPDIPPFDVTDGAQQFPPGQYMLIFGKPVPRYKKDDPETLAGVSHENWVIKFFGTEENPENDVRITFKDNKVIIGNRGVKLYEFYPNPQINPKMGWKANAFFGKFGCLLEKESAEKGKRKIVDWNIVAKKYGQIYICDIIYRESKGNRYRNIDYESITLDSRIVPRDQLLQIETEYDVMAAARRKEESTETKADSDVDDLPF